MKARAALLVSYTSAVKDAASSCPMWICTPIDMSDHEQRDDSGEGREGNERSAA
jgi:hypothetical protein